MGCHLDLKHLDGFLTATIRGCIAPVADCLRNHAMVSTFVTRSAVMLSANLKVCLLSVVALNQGLCRARMQCSCISRSTRAFETAIPRPRSS